MSEHKVDLRWTRATDGFDYETYNRAHAVTFKNGQSVSISAAVAYRGDADKIDPEEAFVASIASCHLLTFLAIACKRRLTVDSYEDDAIGYLERDDRGKLAITRVVLRPRATFTGDEPDAATLREMHERAHDGCFIANSVRTNIVVDPRFVPAAH